MSITFALLNMKGGVGKTTLAVQLAWHFHAVEAANVLLVDLDPQFNASQFTMDYVSFQDHRRRAGTISDLFIDKPRLSIRGKATPVQPSKLTFNLSKKEGKRLDVLPADLSLAWVVKNPYQMDFKLDKALTKLKNNYDYILVDCAPTDSVLTTMALTASDFLLIPMKPDRFSLLGLVNLLETIDLFKDNSPDPHAVKVLGVVLTQLTGEMEIEGAAISEITTQSGAQGIHMFESSLPQSKSFARSVRDQTPIANTWHAKPKAKQALQKIAAEVKLRITVLSEGGSNNSGTPEKKEK